MNEGDTCERHEAGYRWRDRFPAAQRVLSTEGGGVYSAEGEGGWWLITDETALAGIADDEVSYLVGLERFDDRGECQQAVVARRGTFTVLAGENVLVKSVPLIAEAVEVRAAERDLTRVNERDQLQPIASAALREAAKH